MEYFQDFVQKRLSLLAQSQIYKNSLLCNLIPMMMYATFALRQHRILYKSHKLKLTKILIHGYNWQIEEGTE